MPVLGTSFDINELSLIGGIAFCILLSWFYFALRRQHQDVVTVFALARESDAAALDHEKKDGDACTLKIAYELMQMSQVVDGSPKRGYR